jgi:hypothetical protein
MVLFHPYAAAAPHVIVDRGGGTLPEWWLAATTAVALFGDLAYAAARSATVGSTPDGNRVVLRPRDVVGSAPSATSSSSSISPSPRSSRDWRGGHPVVRADDVHRIAST